MHGSPARPPPGPTSSSLHQAEFAGGILEAGAIALVPEAEDRGKDRPQRHEPEEEAIGGAAREQSGGREPFALERGREGGEGSLRERSRHPTQLGPGGETGRRLLGSGTLTTCATALGPAPA